MARRSDHSRDEIHQLALAAAEALIDEGGLQALSARKVASRIGYTVGTLYMVFKNLDDLILQVNGRTLDLLHQRLQGRLSERIGGKDELMQLAAAYIEFAQTETPRWGMLFEYIVDDDGELPGWYQEKLGRVFGPVEQALQATLPACASDKVRQASRVLWASVHGICMLKIRQRLNLAGGQTTRQMVEMLVDNFLVGMGCKE
ncbi:MAG: WHG domain-containing protein [Gammaproteobacteria bacterium]|nr:WHG domain-containing protein [Gammaproteobacteria bacterium]